MTNAPDSSPVAVVTGAASGIGAACAALLRRSGWRVGGIDLNPSPTDRSVQLDVTDADAVEAGVAEIAATLGPVELLVTAAGHYEEGIDVAEITRTQWDRMLAVILGGTLHAIDAVLPTMLARDRGGVVVISSELALAGSATDLHYVAAKGAVLGLMKSMAAEFAHTGVRFNAVAPGPTDTPLLSADSIWREPPYLDTLPLRRLVRPDEVAGAVLHLATNGDQYCGEVLSPNAGAVI